MRLYAVADGVVCFSVRRLMLLGNLLKMQIYHDACHLEDAIFSAYPSNISSQMLPQSLRPLILRSLYTKIAFSGGIIHYTIYMTDDNRE